MPTLTTQLTPMDERTRRFRAREMFVAWDAYRDALLGYAALKSVRPELPCASCRCFIFVEDLTAGPDARPICPRCQDLERGDYPWRTTVDTDLKDAIETLSRHIGALGAVALQQASQSSVELSQNSKGQTQVTVKVYGANVQAAAEQAQALYDALTTRYAATHPAITAAA